MEPRFLTLEEVIQIHSDQIQRYGGTLGIRDFGLLQSAIAMPQAGLGDKYFHADFYEMAAAYVFHIVRNHPFLDGNKRTGAMAAFTFLRLNGIELKASPSDYEEIVRAVAEGRIGKAEAAKFFRENQKPSDSWTT